MSHTPTEPTSNPNFKTNTSPYHRIGVIGLGYVGLPTAILFSQKGFHVHGVDINPIAVELINNQHIDQTYPELSEWVQSPEMKLAIEEKRFKADVSPVASDVFLITVPTPVDPTSHRCDLTAIKAATESLLPVLEKGNLIILESTVPPGTTRNIVKPILEKSGLTVGEDIFLCFCPERILPGNTISELIHNHRVLGGYTPKAAQLAKEVLSQVIEGEIYITDDKSAEFCKLAENTYRDVNIALANELSTIADEQKLDLKTMLPLINQHPRVNILTPGIGVGGHCIAVDPWFFVEISPWKTELIRTSREVNNRMPTYRVQQITEEIETLGIKQAKICCVGLTYKPDIGDTRESPAIRMVDLLKEQGYDVVTYDPLLKEYDNTTLYEAISGCDYLAVLVNHTVIKAELTHNTEKLRHLMRTPQIRIF